LRIKTMFGTIIVSICGIALPIAAGMWLAPSIAARQEASLAETADAMTAAHARRRRTWAAAVRRERFPAGIAPSSVGTFGGNLASGS
jgi:hypothetical protein